MKQFISQYPQLKDFVYVSIYRNGMFRLPNQTKKDKNLNITLLVVQLTSI